MRPRRRDPVLLLTAVAAVTIAALAAHAYETDQYSNRLESIEDSREVLNRRVNRELARVAESWRGAPDERALALAVYHRLGGYHWVDKIERFAMKSPEVDKLPQFRQKSIYRGVPLKAGRVTRVFGVGRTIEVAGALLGSDKLGHFFSQGLKYYRRWLDHGSQVKTVETGAFGERWIFGALTTGIYSNADMVANYEGYLFYRGLLEEAVVAGKPALFRWQDGGLVQRRPFDWADHVNDYWDETLNPSWWKPGMKEFMHEALEESICPQLRDRPEAFRAEGDEALRSRYAEAGLRPAPENRLGAICRRSGEAEEVHGTER